jgi:hypothetical protein
MHLFHWIARSRQAWAILGLVLVGVLALPRPAAAVPSYTRQTGQPCTSCHMNFPELTPFGRAFKLGGYTLSAGDISFPPFSFIATTGFTHTQAPQPGGAAPHFGPNNNFSLEFASLYYAGKVFDNVGAFWQVTYDGLGRVFTADHTDIRYANTASILGNDVSWGITANDAPTVEDIYNTTTAFSFPFTAPGLAPGPAAMSMFDALPFTVGGVGAYAMVNNTFYGDVTLYATFPRKFQRAVGVSTSGEPEIDGVAPYWRFALQRDWDQHSASIGTIGLFANTFPSRIHGFGTDRFLDLGLDSQYQFRGDPHSASVQASWIHEDQRLSASHALGFAANTSDRLDFFKIKASYLYQDTYGATVSYFWNSGTRDTGLFAPGPISGSNNGKPDSSGWVFELDWLPFMHSPSEFAPFAQTKIGLQYTLYDRFNGGTKNYDGFARNASDNNTIFLFGIIAF